MERSTLLPRHHGALKSGVLTCFLTALLSVPVAAQEPAGVSSSSGPTFSNEVSVGVLIGVVIMGVTILIGWGIFYVRSLRREIYRLRHAPGPGAAAPTEPPDSIENLEARMRAFLAGLLIVGIFLVVIWAISTGKGSAEYSALLTPLVGLAGIAIGYFFAQGSTRQGAPSGTSGSDGGKPVTDTDPTKPSNPPNPGANPSADPTS